MPVYKYICRECNKKWEAFHNIENRKNEWCCEKRAKMLISTTAKPIVYEYWSENLDAMVTGRKQKSKLMKEKGVEEAG